MKRVFSIRELEILNILWGTDEPLLASDIYRMGVDIPMITVQTSIKNFVRDGLVEEVGVKRSGTVLGKTYRPTGKSKEVVLQDYMERVHAIDNVLAAALSSTEVEVWSVG